MNIFIICFSRSVLRRFSLYFKGLSLVITIQELSHTFHRIRENFCLWKHNQTEVIRSVPIKSASRYKQNICLMKQITCKLLVIRERGTYLHPFSGRYRMHCCSLQMKVRLSSQAHGSSLPSARRFFHPGEPWTSVSPYHQVQPG